MQFYLPHTVQRHQSSKAAKRLANCRVNYGNASYYSAASAPAAG